MTSKGTEGWFGAKRRRRRRTPSPFPSARPQEVPEHEEFYLLRPTDRAVSALLDDLEGRGLLDSTLIVMASEFGRTPKISTLSSARLPGRDHWGAVQSVFLAGGGVRGGAVLGSSDKLGGHPASDARQPEDLAATVYHALDIPRETQWQDVQGRPYNLYEGKPLELFA